MSCIPSASAPSTPTEQNKAQPSGSLKKKGKRNAKVHFPHDDLLVSCYLEPPDPWTRVYGNTISTLVTAYVAACDKQNIKPLVCVLDQLQEFESNLHKLESNPRVFDLSILGEKLSLKHCEALEEVLRRLQFNLIDLEGCYLEDEGAAAFFDMIEYYDSAVQLNISFTKHIDCRGWQACSRMLKKTTSLVHLNARSTGLNEQVLLIVGRALRLGSNLVTLHLENCGIFGRCLVILVAALKLNTTLRELFLAENKISSADAFLLGNLLPTNTHLELLDLSNNKLGDEGLVHVMESLAQQSNTSGRGLRVLMLWNNELTVKGMLCVARALTSARALRRLNMGSNSITSAGVLELKQSLICNRTIEILELENAQITSEGAIALAEYISQNPFIQKLDISGNTIQLDGLRAFSQALTKNQNVISLKLDPTSMDLGESLKEWQDVIQDINKCCQRNKEAKSSLPPQDAQLSTLFNGIFSHVLTTPVATPDTPPPDPSLRISSNSTSTNVYKGRFRVSVVTLNDEDSSVTPQPGRSLSLDTAYMSLGSSPKPEAHGPCLPGNRDVKQPLSSLVSDRLRWLQDVDLSIASDEMLEASSKQGVSEGDALRNQKLMSKELKQKKISGMSLRLENSALSESLESEPKARRLSSPTISSSAPPIARRTHSIKGCKELEGLDLRSTVPLSPTRLHESFDFPDPGVSEVPMNPQMNLKSSHTVYMVH